MRTRLAALAALTALLALCALRALLGPEREDEEEDRGGRAVSSTARAKTPRARARGPLRREMSLSQARVDRTGDDPGADPAPAIEHLSELDRTPAESQLLWMAEEDLVAACMRERGFAYVPSPPDDEDQLERARSRIERGDLETASAVGYGLVDRIREQELSGRLVDANADALTRMTDQERAAFLQALRGPAAPPADPGAQDAVDVVSTAGGGKASWYRDACYAQARRRLYGDDHEHSELGRAEASLREELLAHVEADRGYQASLAAWRGCMRARGLDEERPGSAAARLATAYQEGKLSVDELGSREIAVATADAACAVAASVDEVRFAAEARGEAALLPSRREELLAMKRARDEALQRAEDVVAAAGTRR